MPKQLALPSTLTPLQQKAYNAAISRSSQTLGKAMPPKAPSPPVPKVSFPPVLKAIPVGPPRPLTPAVKRRPRTNEQMALEDADVMD